MEEIEKKFIYYIGIHSPINEDDFKFIISTFEELLTEDKIKDLRSKSLDINDPYLSEDNLIIYKGMISKSYDRIEKIIKEDRINSIKNEEELTPIELYEYSGMNEMDLDEVKENLYNFY